MNLGIGAPLGLLALIGIPILIALYTIQERHKREQITTLFLIDVVSDNSSATRRIDYLRLPLSFWLQLLAIVLSATLLANLYATHEVQYESVLVMIDGSASMGAFQSRLPAAFNQIQSTLTNQKQLEWTIVASDAPHKVMYQGLDLSKASQILETWKPQASSHSLRRAIEVARQSAPQTQVVTVVTDHKDPELTGVVSVGIGEPRNTVGFSGGSVRADGDHFTGEVLIRNYSHEQQTRRLLYTQGSQPEIEEEITLAPDEIRLVSRKLKSNDGDIVLQLQRDDFPLDDLFPIVLPRTRTITWQIQDSQGLFNTIYTFMSRFPHMEEVSQHPTLQVNTVTPSRLSETANDLPQIQWLISQDDAKEPRIRRSNGAVATNHPLVRSLRFAPLLVPTTSITALPKQDEVLVWKGNQPIISLGGTPKAPILRILFDIRYSNASRLPSFIVLMHRFIDDLRSRVVTLEARNVDTLQLISIPLATTEKERYVKITNGNDSRTIEVDSKASNTIVRAPSEPGLFDVMADGISVLHGAASFQDTREADLSKAESFAITEAQDFRTLLSEDRDKVNTLRQEFEGLSSILIILTALSILFGWLYSPPLNRPIRISRPQDRP
jgi:hypothetical protein